MLPWVSAALLSPALALVVLAILLLATAVLHLVAKEAFAKLGRPRIIRGYLAALVVAAAIAGVGSVFFSLTPHEFIAVLALLCYGTCVSLAVLTVPAVCMFAARGRGYALWAIAVTTLAGVAAAVTAYALRPGGLELWQETRLLLVFLWFVPIAALIGVGFSIGAHLPWTTRARLE